MRAPNRNRVHWIVLLILTACLAAAYFHVCFAGRSMLPSLFYPGRGLGLQGLQEGARASVNTFDVDLATPAFLEYPVNPLIGDLLRSGDLPLWDPYQGCGVPLNAQYSTCVFFPFQALMNMAPWYAWDYFMLFRLLFSGFFTYLFLLACGLSVPAAVLGGMMFMFSGSMVWFVNLQQYINTAMVLPVLMYCAENFVSRRDNAGWPVWTAVSVALVLLAGQPETAAYIVLFAAAYVVFRVLSTRKNQERVPGPRIALFCLCCAAGAGFAACVILPFLEYTRHAFYCHPPGGDMGVVSPAPWNLLVCILMPHLTEVPTFLRFFPHNGVWDYLGGYTGAGVTLLAVMALFSGRGRRPWAYFFFISSAVIVAKNAGLPLVSWIGRLPFLDQVWTNRWAGPVWVFSACCAAAAGADFAAHAGPVRRKAACWTAGGLLASVYAFYAYHIAVTYHGRISDFLSVVPDELLKLGQPSFLFWGPVPSYLNSAAVLAVTLLCAAYIIVYRRAGRDMFYGLFLLVLSELWFCIPKAMDAEWTGYKIVPFCFGAIASLLAARGRRILAALMIAGAAVLMISMDLLSPNGFPERLDPFPETPSIRFLKDRAAGHGRIIADDGILMPNYAGAYALQDIRYAVSMSSKEFQHYVNRHLLTAAHRAPTQQLWFSGIPDDFKERPVTLAEEISSRRVYYDFLGLAYFATAHDRDIGWPLVYDREIKIYENPNRFPRAYIAHALEYAPGPIEAQDAMGRPGFDLLSCAIVEDETAAAGFARGGKGGSPARITKYAAGKVEIEADAAAPGMLVLTDVYYPGWTAYVDGLPARIFRVNGIVRGVLIGAGRHSVIFRYAPASFRAGIVLGSLAILVCAALLITGRKRP